MAPASATSPNRRPQNSPNSTRPARTSRHFDGDKPSFAVPDDYFSPKPKATKSTAYATPLSFGDQPESPRKSVPLTKENLAALHSSQRSTPVVSPPSRSETAHSYMRRNSSPRKSPEKKKAREDLSHPLNLPPDELRRLSRKMAQEGRPGSQADVQMTDADAQPHMNGSTSPPTTPGTEAPGAFPTSEDNNDQATNGVKRDEEVKSPTPPPHRNLPPKMDPEACKAAGNKYFKAKDYDRAVQEYSKGGPCFTLWIGTQV